MSQRRETDGVGIASLVRVAKLRRESRPILGPSTVDAQVNGDRACERRLGGNLERGFGPVAHLVTQRMPRPEVMGLQERAERLAVAELDSGVDGHAQVFEFSAHRSDPGGCICAPESGPSPSHEIREIANVSLPNAWGTSRRKQSF